MGQVLEVPEKINRNMRCIEIVLVHFDKTYPIW